MRKAKAAPARQAGGKLRIIGGQWRGRHLPFPAVPGLRPTGDRVRETLFNWLMPYLPGARCLDLFAGSGALGLEALSRGAAHVDFVDSSDAVSRMLREQVAVLGSADRAEIHRSDALTWLGSATGTYDIVFLDPPFSAGLLGDCSTALVDAGVLSPGALVYREYPSGESPALPAGWSEHRGKRAGDVFFQLLRTDADDG